MRLQEESPAGACSNLVLELPIPRAVDFYKFFVPSAASTRKGCRKNGLASEEEN